MEENCIKLPFFCNKLEKVFLYSEKTNLQRQESFYRTVIWIVVRLQYFLTK